MNRLAAAVAAVAADRTRNERAKKRNKAFKNVSTLSMDQRLDLAVKAHQSGAPLRTVETQYGVKRSTVHNRQSRVKQENEGITDGYTQKHPSSTRGRPSLLSSLEVENLENEMYQRDFSKNSMTRKDLQKHVSDMICDKLTADGHNSEMKPPGRMISSRSLSRLANRLEVKSVKSTSKQNQRRLEARQDLSNYLSLIAVWVQALMGDAPGKDVITDNCLDGDFNLKDLLEKVQRTLISLGTDY
jgi:transposase